ncbi:serine/threonine protein kinase [Thalassoglobus sp.]|uniref:serine/threonine protein kinase n=1 Tax=Thalassoglobus sp. TaxID=2795869 RepID=UPI003AA9BFC6
MPTTSSTFIRQLKRSRILTAQQFQAFTNTLHLTEEVSEVQLATSAVKQKLMTRFQAEEILNGRARTLSVGDYILFDILGYGGMGTVYIAKHRETKRLVAIKLLGEQTKHDAGIRARFQLEARAGMQFDHPKLVKTLELGTLQELYGESEYMVMELVQGVTLLEGINFSKGPLKWDAAADVICQAADGLAYLHELNMVHRDVKPDNILIEVNGNSKLLDFGLTLADQGAFEEEFSLAMIFGHDCLGTADYIPPEQSLDSLNVDNRADIYSLGCTLYTALTAKRPFPGLKRPETVKAHRSHPRPLVKDLNSQAPEALSKIARRMMAINPDERPQTMQEVIELLSPYRNQRNWAFEFNQVLSQRREMRKRYISESRTRSSQVKRATTVNSRDETETPGKKNVTGDEDLCELDS